MLLNAAKLRNKRPLLAFSGGLDSSVLAHLLDAHQISYGVAHVNFQLRGADSDADAEFAKGFAAGVNAAFHHIDFNTGDIAKERGQGIEETARELRYQWFTDLAEKEGYDLILTAHHADDNVETAVMNFFRGTGARGLTGIPQNRGKIHRPLLHLRKAELLAYANEHGIQWREDKTNAASDFTRNKFRNEILPLINQVYPRASENVADNIVRFAEVQLLIDEAVEKIKKRFDKKGNQLRIPVRLLLKQSAIRTIATEIFLPYGFSSAQVPGIINLMRAPSGKYVLSETHRILKDRGHLILTPRSPEQAEIFLIESSNCTVQFGSNKLSVELNTKLEAELPSSPQGEGSGVRSTETSRTASGVRSEALDARHIKFPLLLRKAATGDYFYPFGMRKKKKLSKFFKDIKLSLADKENVWVLESDKRIVWVIGYRIDDRFKITDVTTNTLTLSVTPIDRKN